MSYIYEFTETRGASNKLLNERTQGCQRRKSKYRLYRNEKGLIKNCANDDSNGGAV